MLSRIRQFFFAKSAVEASRDNPLLHAAVRKSAAIYADTPLRELVTEQRRAELSRQVYVDLFKICNAMDPVLACRDKLATAMLRFASYQVLVIPPAPEDDASGLRGLPGISGELQGHLLQIVQKSEGLRAEVYEAADARSDESIAANVQRLYWESFWVLETLNATRIDLQDTESDRDWFKAYKHAACASREHIYRWELELPPAFADAVAGQVSTAYSLFTDIVVSGARDPLAEWLDYHQDSDVPPPAVEY